MMEQRPVLVYEEREPPHWVAARLIDAILRQYGGPGYEWDVTTWPEGQRLVRIYRQEQE